MISIVFPHAINTENNKVLELNLKMIEENTHGEYEVLTLGNMKRTDLVYEGWNYLISKAKYDLILWHNTDLLLAKDWDKPILELSKIADWICLRVIECGAIGVADSMLEKDFGRMANNFRREEFENFVQNQIVGTPISSEGFIWYCPSILKKQKFLDLGGFMTQPPFPNPNDINFRERAEKAKWKFLISNWSYAYHLQRARENTGEKEERK